VHERIEILLRDRRQSLDHNPFIEGRGVVDMIRAAVHDHLMAAVDETRCQFLGERLEAAVVRGDAA
jgi:hypothetical protein